MNTLGSVSPDGSPGAWLRSLTSFSGARPAAAADGKGSIGDVSDGASSAATTPAQAKPAAPAALEKQASAQLSPEELAAEELSVPFLARAVGEALGIDQRAAVRVLEAVAHEAGETLLEAGEVVLPGLVKLRLTPRRARLVPGPDDTVPVQSELLRATPDAAIRERVEQACMQTVALAVPQNDTFARVLDFHFSRAGFRLRPTHNREACLAALAEARPELLIVDFQLPDAAEILDRVKADAYLHRVPVVALYPPDRAPTQAAGFHVLPDEHVVEPFEVYRLLVLADAVISRREARARARTLEVVFSTGDPGIERTAEIGGQLAEQADLGEETVVAFTQALREALANAAQHGNREDAARRIHVRFRVDAEAFSVSVRDEGPGFDHRAYLARCREQDAVTTARERHRAGGVGGLGILLMDKCADEVRYNGPGNEVTLITARS